MIGQLSSGTTQQLIANPFQKQNDQQQTAIADEKKPQENNVQPHGAQAAGSQKSADSAPQDRSLAHAAQNHSSSDNDGDTDQPRGSLLDISV